MSAIRHLVVIRAGSKNHQPVLGMVIRVVQKTTGKPVFEGTITTIDSMVSCVWTRDTSESATLTMTATLPGCVPCRADLVNILNATGNAYGSYQDFIIYDVPRKSFAVFD